MNSLEDINIAIGLVVSHPYHGSPGSVLRVKEISTSLSRFGVKVHVYSPYFPNESWGTNVLFHRLPSVASTFRLQNKAYGLIRKVLNNPFFLRYILKKSILNIIIDSLAENLKKNVTGNVNIIQGEQEIAAVACVRAREDLNVPVITSLHNIWPEELVAAGLIDKTSKGYATLQEIEQEIMDGSDSVVVVSEAMARYIEERYSLEKSRLLVIPPGGRARVSEVRTHEAPFKVVYAGLVEPRANLDLFIKSMPLILEKFPNIKFYITRKGSDLKRIDKLARELSVNPEYYWFPESERFYEFLSSCHIGVVPSRNDLPRRFGPAVKLFDYLSVGLPVVANDIGGWSGLIEEEKIGLLTEDNPESFARAILKLISNEELSCSLGERGLKLVNSKLNWDESAKLLLQKYKDLYEWQ